MDEADLAQINEERERDRALAAALAHPRLVPLCIDGVRVCRDCEEPIGAPRLAVCPGAVRCAECQGAAERRAPGVARVR